MEQPHPGEGHRARLRERFLRAGFEGFAEHEIVELLLTLCIPRRDVKPQARLLLQRFGSLRAVLDADPVALSEIQGMGEVAPVALRIIRETAALYLQQGVEHSGAQFGSKAFEDCLRLRLAGCKHEVFEIALLDKSNSLQRDGILRMEEGTPDALMVYPRKIVEAALRQGATALVLVHNHPSGRADPSDADKQMTVAITRACTPLGLRVLDHWIVTAGGLFSFRRAGLMEKQ